MSKSIFLKPPLFAGGLAYPSAPRRDSADTAESARDGDILAVVGRLALHTYTASPGLKITEAQIHCSRIVNLSLSMEKSQLTGGHHG